MAVSRHWDDRNSYGCRTRESGLRNGGMKRSGGRKGSRLRSAHRRWRFLPHSQDARHSRWPARFRSPNPGQEAFRPA